LSTGTGHQWGVESLKTLLEQAIESQPVLLSQPPKLSTLASRRVAH
jgi:hypothetical protein